MSEKMRKVLVSLAIEQKHSPRFGSKFVKVWQTNIFLSDTCIDMDNFCKMQVVLQHAKFHCTAFSPQITMHPKTTNARAPVYPWRAKNEPGSFVCLIDRLFFFVCWIMYLVSSDRSSYIDGGLLYMYIYPQAATFWNFVHFCQYT